MAESIGDYQVPEWWGRGMIKAKEPDEQHSQELSPMLLCSPCSMCKSQQDTKHMAGPPSAFGEQIQAVNWIWGSPGIRAMGGQEGIRIDQSTFTKDNYPGKPELWVSVDHWNDLIQQVTPHTPYRTWSMRKGPSHSFQRGWPLTSPRFTWQWPDPALTSWFYSSDVISVNCI